MGKSMLGKLPLSAVQGPRDQLEQHLAGDDGELWLAAFKRFLRKENPWEVITFAVWKTIAIGGKTKDQLIAGHVAKSCKVSFWARDIMSKVVFTTATTLCELDLVIATVAELGFPKGGKISDVFTSVGERGLEWCPAEVGTHLRLEYSDQPRGESLWVVMEPISVSDCRPVVFVLKHDSDGLWLSSDSVFPEDYWRPEIRLVCVRPRK